jgi:hypothetical protein
MPKYYVASGTVKIMISRKDALEAAICALAEANKFDIVDEYFYVDERGYRDYVSADPQTNVIATRNVVGAAGWELTEDDPLP